MKNITVTGIALAMLLLAGTPVLAENPVEPERLARISRRALRRTMQKPARRTIPLRRVVYPIPLPHPEYPWGRAQKLSCKLVVKGASASYRAPLRSQAAISLRSLYSTVNLIVAQPNAGLAILDGLRRRPGACQGSA